MMKDIIINNNNVRNSFLALAFIGILSLLSYIMNISISIIPIIAGIPCPACGMGRSFVRLLHLDLAGAFKYHPLFFLIPFVPLLTSKKLSEKTSFVLNISFLVLFIGVWVIRMIIFFPHTSPFEYNNNSLFELIMGLFR